MILLNHEKNCIKFVIIFTQVPPQGGHHPQQHHVQGQPQYRPPMPGQPPMTGTPPPQVAGQGPPMRHPNAPPVGQQPPHAPKPVSPYCRK